MSWRGAESSNAGTRSTYPVLQISGDKADKYLVRMPGQTGEMEVYCCDTLRMGMIVFRGGSHYRVKSVDRYWLFGKIYILEETGS